MKKLLPLLLVVQLLMQFSANAQVHRPFTPRYSNPSVRGNIVFVSNNIITSNVSNSETPPAGTATNDLAVASNIDVDALETIIPWNSTWKMRDSGYVAGAPSTNWKLPTWTDANWTSVTAGLPANPLRDIGYGDLDQVMPFVYAGCGARPGTILPTCDKYWTTYFRQNFTITNIAEYKNFRINLHRDDGAVVYINGIEVARSNIGAGTVNYNTPATLGVEGATEDVVLTIPTTGFVSGNNVIAVEVHQKSISDTTADGKDMSFRLEMLGNKTINSSSANLALPPCSQIMFAGLYWGAATNDLINGTTTMAWITGEKNVKIKLPGEVDYTTVTATQTDYHNQAMVFGRVGTGYRAFADVTALVNSVANQSGTYWVADMVTPHNMQNGSGGWTLVIAYANNTLKPRNLTVFDGNAVMSGGDPALFIPVTGFLTPPGGPVSCELGAIVYDGDRNSIDEFSFKQNSDPAIGTYTNLTPNTLSNVNDMWNGTVSYKGALVTTRNPAYRNTLGYDADIIDVPNGGNSILGNNRTSASIRMSSPQENYFIHVITTSISIYSPSYSFFKKATDLSPAPVTPGDSLNYRIDYENVGNDGSNNTIITDKMPVGTSYKPGSLRIGNAIKTDIPGDDEAEYDPITNTVTFRVGDGATAINGGYVDKNKKGDVRFDVILGSSCTMLSCVNPIKNSARISYSAETSGLNTADSSGVSAAGCILQGAFSSTTVGPCAPRIDTLLTNRCPAMNVVIPWRKYAGFRIYSAKPFISSNLYDPAIPVTASDIYWAFFDNGPGCSDTVKITVMIVGCPDIDDDDDGIPDYVEINLPLALADHNNNGVPNWKDAAYTGWRDYNVDGFNDNFDPGADADNDGVPNFYDINFAGYIDSNGDGINDKMDNDLDGVPNHMDRDSDNDGIPDVAESGGVDENGDGSIDNYTDTDADGFSQNVDASITGLLGSGNGLGATDLDNDGVPNYFDLDSDNDGIPDIVEAGLADGNNDGKLDVFTDNDADGYADNVDGDAGNDGVAENSINAVLKTGPDTSPVDGRADTYPFKNFDSDKRANPYDIDSDMDGIVDVLEAGFTDTNFDGYIDGARGADGWSVIVNAMPSIVLINTDGRGAPDYLDIDSDDDGIPDNIEGQTTATYKLPSGIDTDGDGLDNSYDNINGFSGRGVFLSDKDMDGLPDYRDLDTDSDGKPDIAEGNDFNRNTHADDDVALTFLDTDGDGLDNKFDSLNSVTNIKGTSYNMGTNGVITGDLTPGTRAPVQKSMAIMADRDWRSVGYVLDVQILDFVAFSQEYNSALLTWTIKTAQDVDHFEIERSVDNLLFTNVISMARPVALNETLTFSVNDDIADVNSSTIYYRLKVVGKNGLVKYSDVRAIRKNVKKAMVNIFPNPVNDKVNIQVYTDKEGDATIRIIDNAGRIVSNIKQHLVIGNNIVTLTQLSRFSNGVYNLQCLIEADVIIKKISIQNP